MLVISMQSLYRGVEYEMITKPVRGYIKEVKGRYKKIVLIHVLENIYITFRRDTNF